jgi:ferredoxin
MRDDGTIFACRQDQDVLSAAVRAGIRVLTVGCRGGGCGICRIAVCEGSYTCGRMSKRHIPEGGERRLALACRVYPSSDLIVERAPIQNCVTALT